MTPTPIPCATMTHDVYARADATPALLAAALPVATIAYIIVPKGTKP